MTKQEQKAINRLLNDAGAMQSMGESNADIAGYMARGLSALHRAAMNSRSKTEILNAAELVNCVLHKDFIICEQVAA